MIDPKQESDMKDPIMLEAEIQTLTYELNNARAEMLKYERMHNDSYQDHQVMLHMLQHFTTMFVERRQEDIIKDALEYVYDSCSLDWDVIAEVVERLGIADPDLCKKDYLVTMTIPVNITVSVQAISESDAEEEARNEVDMRGIEDYHMEYDAWDCDIYAEEQ